MKKDTIFISYCNDNDAQNLHKKLSDNEFISWFDKSQLHLECSGEKYWPCIYKAIEESQYFVILLSSNSIKNENVLKEFERAWKIREAKNKKDFILYYILDKHSFDSELTLNNDKIAFQGDEGYQAFLYFENNQKAETQLLSFLSRRLNKPIFISEQQSLLVKEYKFRIGETVRKIKFITIFIADIFYEKNKFPTIKINLFGYKKKYEFDVIGNNYLIKFDIHFNKWTGTIMSINHKILLK